MGFRNTPSQDYRVEGYEINKYCKKVYKKNIPFYGIPRFIYKRMYRFMTKSKSYQQINKNSHKYGCLNVDI